MDPISQIQNKKKTLSPEDIPEMIHMFRRVYGWISTEDWEKEEVSDILEAWSFVQNEYRKDNEYRANMMRLLGAKKESVRRWLNDC
jgi:hypothetical protein